MSSHGLNRCVYAGWLALALTLSACGGSGGGGSAPAPAPPPVTYTVGGTVTGLSGTGLTLTLVAVDGRNNTQSTQTVTVAPGAQSFTFPTGYAVASTVNTQLNYEVSVTSQPADASKAQSQTCIALNGYGFIHAASNVSNVQVTCIANTASPLQGVYALYQRGVMTNLWLAFSADGRYLLGEIANNPQCANNGNGVDYGAYNWNATTGQLQILSAPVHSVAQCGVTDANGVVDSSPRVLTRAGSGANTVLSLVTNGDIANAQTLVPVLSTPGALLGAFALAGNLDQGLIVYLGDGHYVNINPQTDAFSQAQAGIEYGCYTAANGTFNFDTTSTCAGAVETAGTAGFSGGVATTGSLKYALPSANSLTEIFATYSFPLTRFDPDAATIASVPGGYTVGGSITGLAATGSPLVLQLLAIGAGNTASQTISVPPGSTTFTFPNGIALAASAASYTQFEVMIAAQPLAPAQTCVATNAYGQISSATNVTSVKISCVANAPSPLQGFYQLYSDAAGTQPLPTWFIFSPNGSYIFATIGNNPSCLENGNGIDYGAYTWNPATGVLNIETADVYSLAPCGFTGPTGNVDTTVTRNLTRSGTGSATVLTLVTTNGTLGTAYALPVPSATGGIAGAYAFGPGLDQGLLALLGNGHYLTVSPQTDTVTGTQLVAGLEYGCYSVAATAITFDTTSTCSGAVFTAGNGGFTGGVAGSYAFPYATPHGDELQIFLGSYTFSYAKFLPN